MGAAAYRKSITIGCQFLLEIKDSSLESILKAFWKLLPRILTDFTRRALPGFNESAAR